MDHHAAKSLFAKTAPWMVLGIVSGTFMGTGLGWAAHASWAERQASAPCRDEIVNIDGAHSPAACSRPDQMSELRDSYLICKCAGKKK